MMRDLCNQLLNSEYVYKENPNFKCPMAQLEDHLSKEGSEFPVPQADFNYTVKLFNIKTGNSGFEFVNGKLRYYRMSFNIQGIEGKTNEEKSKMFNYYKKIADDITNLFPKGTNSCF